MWNREVQSYPWMLEHVLDQYKTQEMCIETVKKSPEVRRFVPDQYKTHEMCDEAVEKSPEVLRWYKGINNARLKKQRSKKS